MAFEPNSAVLLAAIGIGFQALNVGTYVGTSSTLPDLSANSQFIRSQSIADDTSAEPPIVRARWAFAVQLSLSRAFGIKGGPASCLPDGGAFLKQHVEKHLQTRIIVVIDAGALRQERFCQRGLIY